MKSQHPYYTKNLLFVSKKKSRPQEEAISIGIITMAERHEKQFRITNNGKKEVI